MYNQAESSSHIVKIAVDAMGGDFGVKEVIPALDLALKGRADVNFLIFGDEAQIKPYISKYPDLSNNSTLFHSDKIIKGTDKPSTVLRTSKGSSMRMAIEAVKNGDADAVVSAGNTGALMALSKIILKTVAGIHRPAIASVLPGINGDTIMLDLGANVLVDAKDLVQFAILGAVFARAHKKISRPSVALLNIGSEDIKGPDHVRAAAKILERVSFPGDYKGFVEGDDITNGSVDVIVCDGYAGNIALKTLEGAGKLTRHSLKKSFSSNILAAIGGFFAYFALKNLKERVDPRRYNGGVFLGLNGICIKSHGSADTLAFSNAVILAIRLARQGYVGQIARDISDLTDQETLISQEG